MNYTPKLSTKEVDDTIKKSLDMWSAASQIKFKRVTDSETEADILIKFVTGYHGDGRPTDGPGKELAHAFFPLDNKGVFRQVKVCLPAGTCNLLLGSCFTCKLRVYGK